MKYVTGGFVGEVEAGQRLGQVVADPRCSKSGVYWSWNGGPRQGRGMEALKNGGNIVGAGGAGGDWESIFENDQSDKVRDPEKMALLWQYSNEVCSSSLRISTMSPLHLSRNGTKLSSKFCPFHFTILFLNFFVTANSDDRLPVRNGH